jgi:cysteine-rich repeat protein
MSDGCELDTCGDGFPQDGEECDDGNTNDADSCLTTCQWNSCGDGFRYMAVTDEDNDNKIERCDDGNGILRDACSSTCIWNSCGDGNAYTVPPLGEDCAPGIIDGQYLCDLDVEGPGCSDADANPMNDCGPPSGMEDCDDGNAVDTDSCLASCSFNECGDGAQYTTLTDRLNDNQLETCDDGDASATCTEFCKPVRCGDGIVSVEAGENCDPEADPWQDDDGEGCGADCLVDTCGNETVDMYEECDDGNDIDEDECTNRCFEARCGDGITQEAEGEACDDGNTDPTDGCTNACQVADCGDGIRQGDE